MMNSLAPNAEGAAGQAAAGGGPAAAPGGADNLNSTGLPQKAKAVLSPENYAKFVNVAKAFKNKQLGLDQAQGAMKALLAQHPDLIKIFVDWSTTFHAGGSAAVLAAPTLAATAPSQPKFGATSTLGAKPPSLAVPLGGSTAPAATTASAAFNSAAPAGAVAAGTGGASTNPFAPSLQSTTTAQATTTAPALGASGVASSAGLAAPKLQGPQPPTPIMSAGATGTGTSPPPKQRIEPTLRVLDDPVHRRTMHAVEETAADRHMQSFPYATRPFTYLSPHKQMSPANQQKHNQQKLQEQQLRDAEDRQQQRTRRPFTVTQRESLIGTPVSADKFASRGVFLGSPEPTSVIPSPLLGQLPTPVVKNKQPRLQLNLTASVAQIMDDKLRSHRSSSHPSVYGDASPEGTAHPSPAASGPSKSVSGEWEEWNDDLLPLRPEQRLPREVPAIFRTAELFQQPQNQHDATHLHKLAAPAVTKAMDEERAQTDKIISLVEEDLKKAEAMIASGENPAKLMFRHQELAKLIGKVERTLSPVLNRAWTRLKYLNVEWLAVDYSAQNQQLLTLHQRNETANANVKKTCATLEKRATELQPIVAARRALAPHNYAFRATFLVATANTTRLNSGAACEAIGAKAKKLWELAGPEHNKNSVNLAETTTDKDKTRGAELKETIASMAAAKTLTKDVLALMACHILIRSDSKAEGVKLLLEIETDPALPSLLPTFYTLCMARCAAVLPFTGKRQMIYQKLEGKPELRCPLGLPVVSKNDKMRWPCPLEDLGRDVYIELTATTTEITYADFLKQAQRTDEQRLKTRKDHMAQVSVAAPLCLLEEEWVRVTVGPTALKLDRGMLGSTATTHPAGTRLVPTIMLPDGSTGVTEFFARLLVAMIPHNTTLPTDDKAAPPMNAQQRMYAWFASALSLCSGPCAYDEDKEKIKYMLQHITVFLQFAGAELVLAYPKSTVKAVQALINTPHIKDIVQKLGPLKDTLTEILKILSSADTESKKAEALRAMESKEEDGGADNYVESLLEIQFTALEKAVQDRIEAVVGLLGLNLASQISDIDAKLKKIRGLCCLDPAMAGQSAAQSVQELRNGRTPEQLKQLQHIMQAKVAEHLVLRVAQDQQKMIRFDGGFQGYAWAALLAKSSSEFEEGKQLVEFVATLLPAYCPHVVAVRETKTSLQGRDVRLLGVFNLFASLLQSEELPMHSAVKLAEIAISADAAKEVQARPVQRPLPPQNTANCAEMIFKWVDKFCQKRSLQEAKKKIIANEPDALEALDELNVGAEVVEAALAVCARVWDQNYNRIPPTGLAPNGVLCGYKLVDRDFAIRTKLCACIKEALLFPQVLQHAKSELTQRGEFIRSLEKVLAGLSWDINTGQPAWRETVQGGKEFMVSIGLATGARSYFEVLQLD